MKHTKEPWRVHLLDRRTMIASDVENGYLAETRHIHSGDIEEINARRIVACVNACTGMKNPVEDIAELKKQLVWHDATKEKPEERLLVIVRTKSKFYEPHFNRDFWIVTISNVQNGVWEGIDQSYEVMEWLPIPRDPTDD